MKIQAINDHVIVSENIKTEETRESGLIVPSTVKIEPQKYGAVISVGELVKNIEVGDTIMFHQSAGQAIIMDGIIHRVLKNSEIYGVVSRQVS